MVRQGTQNPKTLEKKNKVRKLAILGFKTYYKAIVIKMVILA